MEFDTSPGAFVRDMLTGGVWLPWNLALCAVIGLWLMLTRLTIGADGGMAHADHLVGALILLAIRRGPIRNSYGSGDRVVK